jgi:bifunctional non-homologous end joining protein LigD
MEEIAAGAKPKKKIKALPTETATAAPSLPEGRKSALPKEFHPMLATLVDAVPPGDDWLHEIKFDGYRILCFFEKGQVRLISRNGNDWTDKFGPVATAAKQLGFNNAILDGEVVIQNPDGTTNFQLLQNYLQGEGKQPLLYEVFDVPYFDGRNLTQLPLQQRKEILKNALQSASSARSSAVRYSDHVVGQGEKLFKSACRLAMEGIISKRKDGFYVQRRSMDWVKVKCVKRQEFIIGGYTEPKGARYHFGSLLLGTLDSDGRLIYRGNVGTGFDEKSLKRIYEELKKHRQPQSPFTGPVEKKSGRRVVWVKPELVAEVEFIGWTEAGQVRHPSFVGLREDQKPKNVHLEKETSVETVMKPSEKAAVKERKGNSKDNAGETIGGVTLTHPERILYPEQSITKRDLAEYYNEVSSWILPQLKNRPVVLVRCPLGHDKSCFYQKHAADAPQTLRHITIEEKEGNGDYLIVDDVPGLISLVQMGVLEIHIWGSTEQNIERPDRLVFDLDPAPDVTWDKLVLSAQRVKERLQTIQLQSFLKTTGGKGLHVVAPIVPELDWDQIKRLTKTMAESMTQDFPGEYVSQAGKHLRPGKIFIDYLRNGRGATNVCPYSTRAKPNAPVSVPLRWEELDRPFNPSEFSPKWVLKRLAKLKKDPWDGFFKLKQKIPAEIKKSLHQASSRHVVSRDR